MFTPLAIALAVAAAVGLAAVAYARLIEPSWLRVRHRTIVVPGWHATADPLRILHLSDLHIGRKNHLLARFMSSARAIPADLVVITGDFVDRPENVEDLADVLRPLMDGAREVVGVLGNHDRYVYRNRIPQSPADPYDARPLIKAIKDSGVRLLVDEAMEVETANGSVAIAGVDIRSHLGDGVLRALAGADLARTVVLAHSPDIRFAAARAGVKLLLTGHTHGGQVRFGPWLTMTTSTKHRLKPPSGLHEHDGIVMHVSPGLGTTMVALRLFSRPEATVLEIRPGPDPTA